MIHYKKIERLKFNMIKKIINNLAVFDFEGSNPPLVFVHAFPLTHEMWENQLSFFADKFRVIAYDVRGLGASESDNNQFLMQHYIDDLLDILKNLDAGKVHAVGLSMGGYIIQGAAIKNPQAFKTLTLSDTKGERDTDEALLSRAETVSLIKSGGREKFISSFVKKLLSEKNFDTGLKESLENIISNNTDNGICGAVLALATRYDYLNGLKSLNIPSLVIVGREDKLTPLSDAAKLNDALGNSVMKIIDDSGHLPNMENPVDFNSVLYNFLIGNNERS